MNLHQQGPFWIDPGDPESPFPPLQYALQEPNGLLAVGGDLSSRRLLQAYRGGIFPWYNEGQPILWWSPDPRCVLPPGDIHISRSLAKTLRKKPFMVTMDRAFNQVMAACAAPRPGAQGTWILDEMQQAYQQLHREGHAHSVEVWHNGQLVGGLYGLAIGKVFFGESMFSRVRDASKIAFVHLCKQLQQWDYGLIDCQVESRHLQQFGARSLPRKDFARQLERLCELPGHTTPWECQQGYCSRPQD